MIEFEMMGYKIEAYQDGEYWEVSVSEKDGERNTYFDIDKREGEGLRLIHNAIVSLKKGEENE